MKASSRTFLVNFFCLTLSGCYASVESYREPTTPSPDLYGSCFINGVWYGECYRLREGYFRYYVPRVLGVYLPTSNAVELKTVFGPITQYLCEAEDPNTIQLFTREGPKLRAELAPLADLLSSAPTA